MGLPRSPEAGGRRAERLDAVRALGVLLVIGFHTAYRFPPADADPVGRVLRVTGWIGVDLFFALSGFLIASILMEPQARLEIGRFFRKRFFRIVPIFVVAVATFAAADLLVRGGHDLPNMWKPLLFLTGYLQPLQGEAVVPYTITWSLSVEVTAYLLMGWVAWAAWTRFRDLLVALVVGALVLRCYLTFGAGWGEDRIGIFVPARIDAIAIGALAALGAFDRMLDLRRAAMFYGSATIALIVAFRFAAWSPEFITTIGYPAFAFVAALWVTALARSDEPSGPFVRVAARVGVVSYFMYLFHLFAIEALLIADAKLALGMGFWSAFIVATAMTVAAALVSWRTFERPLLDHAHRR